MSAMEEKKRPKMINKGMEGQTAKEAHKINADNKMHKAEHHAKRKWAKKQTQTETLVEHTKKN